MRPRPASLSHFLNVVAIAVGWALIALCLFIVVSATARKFFNIGLQGADEYGGYLLAIAAAFGFSFGVLERSHVRVGLLRDSLPAPLRAIFDLGALAVLLVFAVNLLAVGWQVVTASFSMGAQATTALQTPLVVPQSIWVVAFALFVVTCALQLGRGLKAFVQRDWAFIDAELGTKGTAEEVEEELRALRERDVAPGS
jgi:TRAP-type C4-dicarboxylate transport system permease small subunit